MGPLQLLQHIGTFVQVTTRQGECEIAVHPALDAQVQPAMEVQAGEGSDCDNEIIHKRPDNEKTATVRLFFWCGLSVLRLNESNFLRGLP